MARVPAIQLTEKQAEFVSLLSRGVPKCRAAKLAGYSGVRTEAARLLRLPHIQAALEQEKVRLVRAEIQPLAIGRLRGLLRDRTLTGGTLVDAIKLGLRDLDLSAPGGAGDGRALSEMTIAELEERIAKLDNALSVHDAKTIDNVPDNTVIDVPSAEDVFG